MSNTRAMREISHELVLAWEQVGRHSVIEDVDDERMRNAMDAIIAAYTPGYNAESTPDFPEEYVPGTNEPTQDAIAAEIDWLAGRVK
jgi:hypothetical protein